jgi:hypothetical protein
MFLKIQGYYLHLRIYWYSKEFKLLIVNVINLIYSMAVAPGISAKDKKYL